MTAWKTVTAGASALAVSITMSAATAYAQTGNFVLELNNATEVEGNCRLTYVANNNTGISLTETAYEVAVFDGDGRVSNLLVLEFGRLPIAKTKVVQFDLKETDCDNISKIIVNNLATCNSADSAHQVCMDALLTSSRTNIQFGV